MAAAKAPAGVAAFDVKSKGYDHEDDSPVAHSALAFKPGGGNGEYTGDCGESRCASLWGCNTAELYDQANREADAMKSIEIKDGALVVKFAYIERDATKGHTVCCCVCCSPPVIVRGTRITMLNEIARMSQSHPSMIKILVKNGDPYYINDLKNPTEFVGYLSDQILADSRKRLAEAAETMKR